METAPRLIPTDGRPHVSENIRGGPRLARPVEATRWLSTRRISPTGRVPGSSSACMIVERFSAVSADRILYQFLR